MKRNMEISVIIPMYNSSRTIEKVLDSVIEQTRRDVIKEVIVVDDGSSDDSFDIVDKYRCEHEQVSIKLVKKSNGGVSSARNRGIREANGNWIALLDSDDQWEREKIEKQLRIIEDNPDIDFLGGSVDNIPLRILGRKIDVLYKANIRDLCLKSFPATPTILFKKEIVNDIGYYDEKQKYAEDGNFNMRVCCKYNYYYHPESLVKLGFGKKSFGDSGLSANLKGMYKGNIKNIKELRNENQISKVFYIFLRLFYWLKYLRRIVIVGMRKKKRV